MFDSTGNGNMVNTGNKWLPLHTLYRNAAEQLLEQMFTTFSDEQQCEVWSLMQSLSGQNLIPILFLYRHSFELQMKTALKLLDELDDEPERKLHSHALKKLSDELHRRIPDHFGENQTQNKLNPLSERLEYVSENFRVLDEVDPKGFTFRYDDHGYQMPRFELKKFKDTVRLCADTLDDLIDGLGAFLDAKNENNL
jgi:hypothetical protein